MSENVIKVKSFSFALRIVKLYQFLSSEKKEFVLSKQLLRSGTAIGALVREAEQAESKPDFIHKLAIAQKEANETDYWLRIIIETFPGLKEEAIELKKDCKEIIAMLVASTKTLKKKP